MTPEQFQQLLNALGVIGKAVAPHQWDSFLVGSGQHAVAPAEPEVAANPGKYFNTQWDILNGSITSTQVIELFSPPADDGEGGKIWKFVSGTLYQWAKADLPGFMRYYEHRYKTPLDLTKLHPDQRSRIGL